MLRAQFICSRTFCTYRDYHHPSWSFVNIEPENFSCHYFLWPSNMMHLPSPMWLSWVCWRRVGLVGKTMGRRLWWVVCGVWWFICAAKADWQLKYNFRKEIIIEPEQKPQRQEAVKVKHQSECQDVAGRGLGVGCRKAAPFVTARGRHGR